MPEGAAEGKKRRRWTAAAILGLTATAALAAGAGEFRLAYHAGPPSDHFDGVRFFDPAFPTGKGLWDVIQWRLRAETAQWPESVPLAATAKPPARVHGRELRVTWVGHATVLVQTAGLNVLTDPIWSERAFPLSWAGPRRVTPPGIAFEDLPPIDLVFITHNHYDHLDLPTLVRLQRAHDPLFVVPLGNDAILHSAEPALRVQSLDWWQSVAAGPQARVHLVPVYHWSRRRSFDRNKALWGGFVLETPGGPIYFSGDTGFGDGTYYRQAAARFGGFRLALLPIGAYEPRWFMKDHHMNPAEAVDAHLLLGARATLGIHYRTFQLTDEAIDQPELDLAAARRDRKVTPEAFFTLPVAGSWAERPGASLPIGNAPERRRQGAPGA